MQPALAVSEFVEPGLHRRLERQRRELPRRLPELLAQLAVFVEQRGIIENQVLARDALERRRLLVQEPAGASCLRGLQHLLAALRLEPVERQDHLGERVNERQADEQEAEQDEFEERARVVHASGGSAGAGWL